MWQVPSWAQWSKQRGKTERLPQEAWSQLEEVEELRDPFIFNKKLNIVLLDIY